MNDFRSYNPPEDKNNRADLDNTVNLANQVMRAMNGKSEGQILHTILAEAERGKRAGTLSNADLDNFYNTVSPMVNGAQRKKLREVISRLKQIYRAISLTAPTKRSHSLSVLNAESDARIKPSLPRALCIKGAQ